MALTGVERGRQGAISGFLPRGRHHPSLDLPLGAVAGIWEEWGEELAHQLCKKLTLGLLRSMERMDLKT